MSQPEQPGDVIGQELQRDDRHQRLDDLGHVGDRQEDVGQTPQLVIPLGADGDHRPAAGAHFLDVAERLGVERAPAGRRRRWACRGRSGRAGRASSRPSDSPRRGCSVISLSFSAPSSATGKCRSRPRYITLRAFASRSAASMICGSVSSTRPIASGTDSIASTTARPSEKDRYRSRPSWRASMRQHGDLRREGLRAGDADLGPGVEVDAAVGLAGDRRADDVADGQRRMPPPLRLAEGPERVGRLARLAEDEDERPVVERGVPVAELARVLDLDGQVRQPLDQVFANQGRVPARAAGGEDDAADAAELRGPRGSGRRTAAVPSLRRSRPRQASRTVFGCSRISLSM